ncbi:acyl-CoA dehydrogenase family protein, partial [Streptomyces fulvoviolaceus]|uniref:acyl-CoA dehydrogenase family protein n=1 Tax=Streptomyces fulvoviolaceus TaxID=285535 RepID=UPI0022793DCE
TQHDVWGDNPDSWICAVYAGKDTHVETLDNGWRVTGRWSYASGSAHSQWAILGVPMADVSGAPDVGLLMIPTSELTVEDTWFVSGMRGTSSNTLVAQDIFVPSHRRLSLQGVSRGELENPNRGEVLYRSAFGPVSGLCLAAPQVGLAQAALDLVIEKAPKRPVPFSPYPSQAQAPTVQLAVAKAASLVDSAKLHLYRAAAEVDESAHQGVTLDVDGRARNRMDGMAASHYSREAIRILISAHGSGSFAESNPLQRIWRDCEVPT